MKKGDLQIQTVVIAIIVLIVLVVLMVVYQKQLSQLIYSLQNIFSLAKDVRITP